MCGRICLWMQIHIIFGIRSLTWILFLLVFIFYFRASAHEVQDIRGCFLHEIGIYILFWLTELRGTLDRVEEIADVD